MNKVKNINFSIVIPLYNKEKEIERTINSVLRQTWKGFELIIVDDGSTDNSASIVARYKDSRIKLIQQDNAGVSAARNTGIDVSNYAYIAFLDADDVWRENYLDIMNKLICAYPDCGAYATAYDLIDIKGKRKHLHFASIPSFPWEGRLPSYYRAALEGEPLWTSAVVVPKTVLMDIGKFPIDTSMGEDKYVWERIALKYEIAYSNQLGATYFLNSSNRICTIYFENIRSGRVDLFNSIEKRRPFYDIAQAAILRNEVILSILPDLKEYLEKYKLISAAIYIKYAGEPRAARNILKNTFPQTKLLKRQKKLLYVISLLPSNILSFAIKAKDMFVR